MLGLPSPERRIGLAAHDFAQAACAPEVILLHTERREGAPAVKSRWLWRLETLARGAALAMPGRHRGAGLGPEPGRAQGGYDPIKRPAPIAAGGAPAATNWPSPASRALTRDPYAVWARDILRLYPLDRPDEQADARARGTAIHAAFERFADDLPRSLAG